MPDLTLAGDRITVVPPRTPSATSVAPDYSELSVGVGSPGPTISVLTPAPPDLVNTSPPEAPGTVLVPVGGTPSAIPGPPGPPGIRYTGLDPVELPSGSRTQFTSPVTYVVGSLAVYLNGLQEHFVTQDSDTTFNFSTAPLPGDVIKLELTPASA